LALRLAVEGWRSPGRGSRTKGGAPTSQTHDRTGAIVLTREAVLACHQSRLPKGGIVMGGKSLNASALPKWGRTRYGAEPRPNDAFTTWSPEQLVRMDSDFCTRVRIAFGSGGESVRAATATYDLPVQRRAS
jgi:hypothetical protein